MLNWKFWQKAEIPIKYTSIEDIEKRNKEFSLSQYSNKFTVLLIVFTTAFYLPLFISLADMLYQIVLFVICWGGGGIGILAYYTLTKQKVIEEASSRFTLRVIAQSPAGFHHFKMVNCEREEFEQRMEDNEKEADADVVSYTISNKTDSIILTMPRMREPFLGQIRKQLIDMFEVEQQTITVLAKLVGLIEHNDEKLLHFEVLASEAMIREGKIGTLGVSQESLEKFVDALALDTNRRTRGYELEQKDADFLDWIDTTRKVLIETEAKADAKFNRFVQSKKDLIGFGTFDRTQVILYSVLAFIIGILTGWLLWG